MSTLNTIAPDLSPEAMHASLMENVCVIIEELAVELAAQAREELAPISRQHPSDTTNSPGFTPKTSTACWPNPQPRVSWSFIPWCWRFVI
ncbi:MAG: hypothetical protein P8Q36_13845 [Alphaproteobacteria bacterium]|jgi:hypothetical protein|nr:hypothetical protein [Rhodospirillaceae bacterium]MBT6206345.1 hypothetical protein [Rhodospirillaceae bacterium]MBT7614275.1 hypothetical protein [Rhodospirillaceae bacterium]MBT7648221.1 hypothetical protein [Rhodospirillaceae bacterium]MDG2481929.1 hypothetical protein [Alphaproteobacteria bacterium]